MSVDLNHYLSAEIQVAIEKRYYAQINERSRLDVVSLEPEFLGNPGKHIALFSDHGVVHVRDVANKMVTVLETVHGELIQARSSHRLAFMQGYGVMVAYLHDIGLVDFSKFGRVMHPEYASQHVFKLEFNPILDTIWTENWGNIAWRLTQLAAKSCLPQAPQEVLREMLALSNCHSKSKVPTHVFNDRLALRHLLQTTLETDLQVLYYRQQIEQIKHKLKRARQQGDAPLNIKLLTDELNQVEAALNQHLVTGSAHNKDIDRYYSDLNGQSFQWLVSSNPDVQAMVDDVIDTLRVLRCADALRQRGTVLKTSGGYEVFIDRNSARAIYALRYAEDELYMLELEDPISAGEANIASSELDPNGNLRISFHRGQFAHSDATWRAAHASALMVNDIQSDVIDSFCRSEAGAFTPATPKSASDMQILLEETHDNFEFTGLVLKALSQLNPDIVKQVQIVPGLNNVGAQERNFYLSSPEISWGLEERRQILTRIGKSGHKTDAVDPELGFKYVKLVELYAGDVLIEAGLPADFVYIPLGQGLRVYPLGGYSPFDVHPWMPLGNTAVIRGATRNATVVAVQSVRLLMIPKEVYLRYWHHTYSRPEFVKQLQLKNAVSTSI